MNETQSEYQGDKKRLVVNCLVEWLTDESTLGLN